MKDFIQLIENLFNTVFKNLNLPISVDGTVFIVFFLVVLALYLSLKAH